MRNQLFSNHTPLLVKRLCPEAFLPTVAYPGTDLGFDLYALEDVVLCSGMVTRVRTGIAVAMEGFGFRIADRSSMALLGIKTSGGVIDEGYTGEMFANLMLTTGGTYKIFRGDKIAQFIPQRVQTGGGILEVRHLPKSKRADKGYGSTGSRAQDVQKIRHAR